MSKILAVKNPRTGDVDYEITAATADDISIIADKSRTAQIKWRSEGIDHRVTALLSFADAIEAQAPSIIAALSIDTGRKNLSKMEVFGVFGAIRNWATIAPALLPKPQWQEGRSNPIFKHTNDYVPYSLVGVISPWNFPMTLSFIDAVPALLAGCSVIVKPSEVTPRFADCLMPIIAETELSGIFSFIQGDGATGAALVSNVDCICFTGSVATGRKVAINAAENLIPANLELGGKDPLIITPGADIETAATLALRSSVLSTGQACQSIERVYVPRAVYSEFTSALAAKAKAVTLNYPDISDGHIGPFIFGTQAKLVAAQIEDAVQKGARILSGGEILRHGGGYWLEPTVIIDVTHDMEIMKEETFGPVIPVMAYDTIEDALRLANDTEFGLSAGVFATSIEEAHEIAQHIDAGAISLMDASLTGLYFEAGKQSFKNSGLGASRMGANGLLRFLRQKAYIANTASPFTIENFKE